jgi:DNA-binding CsgD family transcriptional regulator
VTGMTGGIGEILNHSETIEMLEISHGLVSCGSVPDFMGSFGMAGNFLWADHALCGLGRVGPGGEVLSHALFNLDIPADFLEAYFSLGIHKGDPIVHRVMTGETPCFWRKAFAGGDGRHRMAALLADHGLSHGCSTGLASPGGEAATYFVLSSTGLADHDPRFTIVLAYLTPFLHQALTRVHSLDGRGTRKPVPLSGREIEVLRWVRAGKNNWDISQILDVSENTVKFHLKNILRKMGASNRGHAVAIAMEEGILRS